MDYDNKSNEQTFRTIDNRLITILLYVGLKRTTCQFNHCICTIFHSHIIAYKLLLLCAILPCGGKQKPPTGAGFMNPCALLKLDFLTSAGNKCIGYSESAATQCNATQRNATQRNATQRNATQRNATQRNATQRNATQRNATQRNATQSNATQRNTAQRSAADSERH